MWDFQVTCHIWRPYSYCCIKFKQRAPVEVRAISSVLSAFQASTTYSTNFLYEINAKRTLAGISFKTQALYVAVFVSRYLDLLYRYVSLYNSVMKLFFIASSCYILFLMKFKYRSATTTIFPITIFNPPTDQLMTLQLIPFELNTSLVPVSYSPSSSITSSLSRKSYGLFRFSSSRLPYCLSCSCFKEPERRKLSPRII